MSQIDKTRIRGILEKMQRAELAGAMQDIDDYAGELAKTSETAKIISRNIIKGIDDANVLVQRLEEEKHKWHNQIIEAIREMNRNPDA